MRPDLNLARSLVLVLLLLVGLSACGQLPRPYQPQLGSKTHNEFLILSDTFGVSVLPVEGLPEPVDQQVAEAMALALQTRGVPASARTSNRSSYFLSSTASPDWSGNGTAGAAIKWDLIDANGERIDEIDSTMPLNGRVSATALGPVIVKVATLLAERLVGPQEKKKDPFAVTVMAVEGAPGDGNISLQRSLEHALRRKSIPVKKDISDEGVITLGDVAVEPVSPTVEQVRLSWSIVHPDGREIASLDQENRIPKGQLDGSWGEIAYIVADAASDGIVDIITKYREALEKGLVK